jgi:hypothetical protein
MASTVALGRALETLRDPTSAPRARLGGIDPDGATTLAPAEPGPDAAGGSSARLADGPDGVQLMAAAEVAMDGGDAGAVRTAILAASAEQRRTGQFEAALDTCYMALAIVPADPDIHLALAALYLDRGWRVSAVDKVILLGRLADLTDDDATHDRLAALVEERLKDEPRLAARYG